jgi:YVTN family beta-propeller protein
VRYLLFLFLNAASLSYAAAESRVVVVNGGDATVTIYAAVRMSTTDQTLKLLRILPTGKGPQETCVSPDGKRAYVSNRADISVTVVDLDNLAIASTITDPAMKNPDGCVVTADGSKLYVAAAGSEAVFAYSTSDGCKLNEIKVGKEPRRLLLSPDGTRLYVSNGEERYVSVVDVKTNTSVAKIRSGRDPRPMIFSPDGQYIIIGNVSDDTVQFVKPGETDPEFVVGVPKSPQRLLAVPSKQALFAIGRVDNVLSILELRPNNHEYGRTVSTLPIGRAPWGMALSAEGDCIYVTNTADNSISIVDLRLMRTLFTIPTGKSPLGLAVTAN